MNRAKAKYINIIANLESARRYSKISQAENSKELDDTCS